MSAQSKLELILEWKNKIKSGLSQAKKQVSGSVGKMNNELSSFRSSAVKAFGAAKDEIPGLARGLELVTNKYVLMAAAVVGIATGMAKATQRAADFNHEFLDIRQLNLDKSSESLDNYRQMALDTAFDTGISAAKMSKAFYDIQSGLGIYGDEVAQINQKLGDFSIATKADFGDSVNASIKAMSAFGFGVEKLDNYLASNAKTVQVGITTFKELAQVQTEYAGAAASAGQGVDTANKIFAAFTKLGKDSATSATLAKTAFQGITQKTTIDGLKKMGINLFDANGQMKDMTAIIREAVPKIKQMSDSEFSTLRNAIGGPEGLQALFNQMRAAGDDMLATFDAFDASRFNIDDALKNAKGDFNTLKDIVGNRLNVVLTELGSQILPTVARALNWINTMIVSGRNFFHTYSAEIKTGLKIARDSIIGIGVSLALLKAPALAAFLAIKLGAIASSIASWTLAGSLRAVGIAIMSIPIIGWIAALVTGLVTAWHTSDKFRASVYGIMGAIKEMLTLAKPLALIMGGLATGNYAMVGQGVSDLKKAWNDMDIKGAFNKAYDETLAEAKAKRQEEKAMTPEAQAAAATNGTPVPDGGGASGFTPGGSMEGSSGRVRNITVNIEAFHKGDNIISGEENGQRLTMDDVVRRMNDEFLRMIRNVETSAG